MLPLAQRIEEYEKTQEQIYAMKHPYHNIIVITFAVVAIIVIAAYIIFC